MGLSTAGLGDPDWWPRTRAGGGDSTLTLPVATEAPPADAVTLRVRVHGCMGGHSGINIQARNRWLCSLRLLHVQGVLGPPGKHSACLSVRTSRAGAGHGASFSGRGRRAQCVWGLGRGRV
jgi:hypothetical protein